VVLTVFTGEGSSLELPIRPPSPADADLPPFEPAEQAPGLRREVLESAPGYHELQRDPSAGTIALDSNGGGKRRYRFVDSGIEYTYGFRDRFSIHEGDPLTAEVLVEVHYGLGRGSWQVRVETTSTMSSDANAFHLQDRLEAYEGPRRVFVRSWSRSVPRDHL
jgi:hypothetical protein